LVPHRLAKPNREKEEINGHQLIRKNRHPENRCTLAAGGNISIYWKMDYFYFLSFCGNVVG
jgi:hypothetical protein